MLQRDPRDRAAFQIDRRGACHLEQVVLLGRACHGGLPAQQRAAIGLAQKRRVGRQQRPVNQQKGRDHNGARPQRGVEPAGETEADQRRRSLRDEAPCRVRGTRGGAAADGDRPAEPPGDPGLRPQPDDDPEGNQKPNATLRELPRRRLRYRAIASSGKNSR